MPKSCCALFCSSNRVKNPEIKFFLIPNKEREATRRAMWLQAIHREENGRLWDPNTKHVYVCSRHFITGTKNNHPSHPDYVPSIFPSRPSPESSSTQLKRPEHLRKRELNAQILDSTDDPQDSLMEVIYFDHDYSLQPISLDVARRENQRLRAKSAALRSQLAELALSNRFGLNRFAASDDDIMFYTRFPSYAHLMSFWRQIEPATWNIMRVTRAQSPSAPDDAHHTIPTSFQPIDEFFLFLTCLSLGLLPEDLAHTFQLHQAAVHQIIFTWANFLYTILGSVGIWLDEATVRSNMPEVFSDFPETHIVLVCTEVRCQTLDHLLLHNEVYSSLRTNHTFKGLIGMAPHGPVVFVSPLCSGGISDRKLLQQSGLVPLLRPSTAIVVDKSFVVEDLVPCKVHVPELQTKNFTSTLLRAHIEALKRRVVEHELFSTVVPFSLRGCVNQLFTVACLLVNYQKGQLKLQA